jgi:hypothetical protein
LRAGGNSNTIEIATTLRLLSIDMSLSGVSPMALSEKDSQKKLISRVKERGENELAYLK